MAGRLRFCLVIWVAALCVSYSRSQDNQEIKNCLPPNIRQQSISDISYFIADTKVDIPCIARGDEKLTYTWLKNEEVLDLNSPEIKDRAAMNSGVGTLSIIALEADEGVYQCSVTNECGTSLSLKTVLKLAQMVPFPRLDKPTELREIQGHNLTLTCNPPECIPKPKITWILTDSLAARNYDADETPVFSTVPLDNRVTTDYNGNLYITSVRKEDEQNGLTYVCQAENTFTRSTNKGEDKRIIVYDRGSVTDMGVGLIWHSETETLVLEGKKARFKCIFSGHPEPKITWTKVAGNYDRHRVSIEYNEMTIPDVQYEDAGEYKCSAQNKLTRDANHIFKLTVEAAPVWKIKPREVTVGVGESAVFKCDANGKPPPTVKWFINGRPYEDVPSILRRELKNNTLTFTNLEKDDSQVIQCNATNVHGSIWSDVYLYVQAIAPVIEVKPADEVIVAEGKDLRVICQVTGKPNPRVIWYKGNQQLVHDRFEVQANGDLLIKNTDRKDTGSYRCAAENKFGKAEATGKVMVREKTRIVTKPINAQVDYTNPIVFTCSASTDPAESSNLRITWLKNGVEVKPSDRIIITSESLTITETNSKDTASYTCFAGNGLDNETATASLEVKAVPDPPYDVTIKECMAKSATIEWKFDPSMRNFDTMIKFIVEYQTTYKSGVWTEATSANYPADKAFINLSPFAEYTFRVRAVNLMGTSEPSGMTSSICKTPMSFPGKNPDNVRTDESYTGFLVVKWDPVEQIDENGPDFRYVVEVQEQTTEKVQIYVVNGSIITEKHIPVENIYRPYYIRVRSENQVGKAPTDPLTYTGHSGEAPPLVVPDNFELDPDVNVTATSAGFRWDPVDESPEKIRGQFSGYKIRFWKTGEMETTLHEHIVQTDSSSKSRNRRDNENGKIRGLVANLPSYADIEADVVVINKNFESNGSNVVNFSTPEGVPGRVAFLEAAERGSHHFSLRWGKPIKANGLITGYQMTYRNIDTVTRLDVGEEITAFDNLGPNEYSVILKDLQPDSQYRIYIRAQTDIGLGEEFFIDVQTISEVSYITLPVIQNISPGENEANITWLTSAEKGSRHGEHYYIEYKKTSQTDPNDWQSSKHPIEGQNWGVLRHLEPGTEYEVRVVAMSHAKGERTPGVSTTFTTAGIGAARASFFTAAWFIGMMVAIGILILILIIVCIVKRNRGDNYPVQEKERLRGTYNDENPDNFNDFGKGDENGIKGSGSFDQDAEKVPLDEDADSLDYGDDDGSKFNEDGSFIGQYGRGEKGSEINASSIV